jgi:hypothetical protein
MLLPSNSYTPNASSTLLGKIKLAGDLGGTAGLPLVKRTHRFLVAPFGSPYPADYICANNTNNEVEINAAINAAKTLYTMSGYAVAVDLLEGDFYIGARVIPRDHVWLKGQGMFSTRIHATSALTRGMLDNITEYDTATPYVDGIISDLELDGTGMDQTKELKGLNSDSLNNCKIMRIYAHDTTATGLGPDDFYGSTLTECLVVNCGYMNKKTLTNAVWASNQITFTTSAAHGYSVNDVVVITGMAPVRYNGRRTISSVPTTTTFVVTDTIFLNTDPGAATTFGISSDSLIGHNGIGIASGSNTHEASIVTNNVVIGSQNNNYLIEADATGTDLNASYIFANNYSSTAGQCGFRNTGSRNTQFLNNYDYGSIFGVQVSPVTQIRTISSATWSAGIVTVTLSSAYTTNIVAGDFIEIAGMTPSGYNGYYRIETVVSNSQFTIAIASNPGAATVFGTATRIAHNTDDTLIENNIFSNSVLYGVRMIARAEKYNISGNTVKNSANYGISLNTGYGTVDDNHIYGCGRDGITVATGSGTYAPLDNLTLSINHIYNNGLAGTYDGIAVEPASTAPISNLTIIGNRAFDDQVVKTQRYGVLLSSGGTLTNVSVTDNNLTGNATAPMLIQNTGNTIYVTNNGGVNPVGKVDLGNITGATTFDSTTGNYFIGTVTGNVTTTIPSGVVKGMTITLILTQDATGGWTMTTPVNVKPANGSSLVFSTAANAVNQFMLSWDGSNWREMGSVFSRIGNLGSAGQVLTSNGSTTLPTWQGANVLSLVATSVNYATSDTNDIVEVSVSGKIVTLHDATTAKIKRYTIKNTSAGNVSFATTSSQTVDGSTTGTIIPNQALEVVPDGSNWIIT